VITQPQLEEVSNSSSNLGLDVTNDSEEPVRLTVKFNDKSAIDVKIPGHPSDCHDSRVYRYSYRLPEGQVTVIATTDRGGRGTATPHVGGNKRWAVVQVQDGFPLQVQVFDSRPIWG
jgi:hypothetical protein